jgi:hypothetical protein
VRLRSHARGRATRAEGTRTAQACGTRVAGTRARAGARPRARGTRRGRRRAARARGSPGQGLGWGRGSAGRGGRGGARRGAQGAGRARPGSPARGTGWARACGPRQWGAGWRRGLPGAQGAGARAEAAWGPGRRDARARVGARDLEKKEKEKKRKGRGREREKGRGGKNSPPGLQFRRSRLQTLGHHGEGERGGRRRGCCAGNPNERGRGGVGAWGGAWGARGAQGWAGLGWVGLGWATSRIETRDMHDHQTELNREPKSETERDEHATSDKEMRFGMMQHP